MFGCCETCAHWRGTRRDGFASCMRLPPQIVTLPPQPGMVPGEAVVRLESHQPRTMAKDSCGEYVSGEQFRRQMRLAQSVGDMNLGEVVDLFARGGESDVEE